MDDSEELGGVEGEEIVISVHCMGKESIFNKGGKEKRNKTKKSKRLQ